MGRPARQGGHTRCSRASLGCLWAGGVQHGRWGQPGGTSTSLSGQVPCLEA